MTGGIGHRNARQFVSRLDGDLGVEWGNFEAAGFRRAFSFRGSGARVRVTACGPICALQICMEGFQITSEDDCEIQSISMNARSCCWPRILQTF